MTTVFLIAIVAMLGFVIYQVRNVMATMQELTAELNTIHAQVTKIGTETSALITMVEELEAAIAAGGVTTPEVDAAMAALKAQVSVVDNLVPDA